MEKVILLCNMSNDSDKGILQVLGSSHRSNEFVQHHLFKECNEDYSCLINDYLFISKECISRERFDDWQLLLIKDTILPINYDENIDFSNSYIMHHSTPDEISLRKAFINSNIKSFKQGTHEYDYNGYPLIRDLAEAYNPQTMNFNSEKYDKFIENIIKWFDVDDYLEEVLTFLHNCLIPNTESFPKSLPNSLKVDKQAKNNNALNLYEILKGEKEDGPFGEKYIKALSDLRDELLKDY